MKKYLLGAVWLGVVAAVGGAFAVLVGVAGAPLHWSFDFFAQFLLPATVVVGAAALVALAFRWPALALAAAVVTVTALATAAPWTTGPHAIAKDAPRFKVLLFNIWVRNQRLSDLRGLVERANADIVVFVETSSLSRAAMDEVATLYPYRFSCVGMRGCDITIFARSRLTSPAAKETNDSERSSVTTVETEVAGCRMKLFAAHLTRPFPHWPYGAQRSQAEEVGVDVGQWPGAKLLVGDFNAAPWGYVVRAIESRGGVGVLTGAGGTWPSALPPQLRIPIDHMMAGPGLSFVSRQVLPSAGSDHLPVLGEVAVVDPTQCG